MDRKFRMVILPLVLATIAVTGFQYWNHRRTAPATERGAVDAAGPSLAGVATAPAAPVIAPSATQVAVNVATADEIARWTADATGADAARRARAITTLAQAPVAQALPVLRRVLMNGEPVTDRPLALQSLRDLALNRGDPNSAIRNAIREAIYHGDDQTMAADAQEALDVIEEGLMK
jgi:hypothetical protein